MLRRSVYTVKEAVKDHSTTCCRRSPSIHEAIVYRWCCEAAHTSQYMAMLCRNEVCLNGWDQPEESERESSPEYLDRPGRSQFLLK